MPGAQRAKEAVVQSQYRPKTEGDDEPLQRDTRGVHLPNRPQKPWLLLGSS